MVISASWSTSKINSIKNLLQICHSFYHKANRVIFVPSGLVICKAQRKVCLWGWKREGILELYSILFISKHTFSIAKIALDFKMNMPCRSYWSDDRQERWHRKMMEPERGWMKSSWRSKYRRKDREEKKQRRKRVEAMLWHRTGIPFMAADLASSIDSYLCVSCARVTLCSVCSCSRRCCKVFSL